MLNKQHAHSPDNLFRYSGRQALALAFTGMMNDGEITRERAPEMARMVMRDNAIGLYKLEQK